MTDRELLELAAKAAGKPIRWDGDVCVLTEPDWSSDQCSAWNPLTDDGDALRLAVKLRMMVDQTDDTADALLAPCAAPECMYSEPLGSDPYAATRRAIVRAAAELGRQS